MKKITLRKYTLIQYIALFIFIVVWVICFTYKNILVIDYFPIVMYSLSIAATIVEAIIYKEKPKPVARLIVFGFGLLFFLAMAYLPTDTTFNYSNWTIASFCLFIFLLVHFFVLLFYYFIGAKKYDEKYMEGEVLKEGISNKAFVINNTHRYIPVGFYSKKEYFLVYLISFATMLVFAGVALVIMLTIKKYALGAGLFVLGVVLDFVLLIVLTLKFSTSDFKKYSMDLDASKLENKYNEHLKEDLHPETRNFLKIFLAAIYYDIDDNKYEEYMKDTFRPTHVPYLLSYDNLKLSTLLYEEKYEEFDKQIDEILRDPRYIKNKSLYAKISNLAKIKKAVSEGTIEGSIDLLLPINLKSKYENLGSCFYRIKYYKLIRNEENFNKMKDYYLTNGERLVKTYNLVNSITFN